MLELRVNNSNPGLPNDLYDSRYVLTANITAGSGGTISINIIPGSGNQKINGFEVIGLVAAPPPASVSYSTDTFSEAIGNDGQIGNAIVLTVQGDQFTGVDGDDFLSTGMATVTNIPDGLAASLTRQADDQLVFTLGGQAVLHTAAHSLSNLSVTLLDGAFASASASAVDQAVRTNLVIEFRDAAVPVISYDGTVFQEASQNDGRMGNGLTLTLSGDEYAGTNSEDFVVAGRASVANVPSGLSAILLRQSATTLAFSLSGQAASHAAADSLSNLTLTLLDDAFASGVATQAVDYSRTDLQVVFADPAAPPITNGFYLSWSSVPGKRYTVDWTSNLVNYVVVASNIPADLALTGLTAAPPSSAVSPVIYRIRVE